MVERKIAMKESAGRKGRVSNPPTQSLVGRHDAHDSDPIDVA